MSFKKIMNEKGPEMVRTAAKEIETKRNPSLAPQDPTAIAPEAASKLVQEIQKNGRITSSVPLSKIIIEENVRKQFLQQSIKDLGESLKDVGLLHNVILHIVESNGNFYFHCVSGKRRVLAAKSIGWEKIDADITLSQDPIESLYVGAIANLHESVFWLDHAILYSKLSSYGHTDEQISTRVKVNSRTVGWFKRLAKMSSACQNLAYTHPELFNSRWAQQLARHGELPDSNLIEANMRKMVVQKRTWHIIQNEINERPGASSIDKSDAILTAHKVVTNLNPGHLEQTKNFLNALAQSGFLTQTALKKIQDEFFKDVSAKDTLSNQINEISATEL